MKFFFSPSAQLLHVTILCSLWRFSVALVPEVDFASLDVGLDLRKKITLDLVFFLPLLLSIE